MSDAREGGTPSMSHEAFAEDLAAYAVDALDDDRRAALEAHVAGCDTCQQALAEFGRLSTALGLSTEPVPPPAGLRDRVLAGATAHRQPGQAPAHPARAASRVLPWLVAAAAVFVAALALGYTLALRSELTAAQRAQRDATALVEALQARVDGLEDGVGRLQQVVDVVTAPDVRQVRLSGSGPAADADALAYLSASRGLVVHAAAMPALDADRGYQLWVIPPGQAPVSLGMLAVAGDTASRTVALPAGVTGGTVAVTIEAAGGAAGGAPTSQPILAGGFSG